MENKKPIKTEIITSNSKDIQVDNIPSGNITAQNAYAGTIRTASRFTSGHSAGVDSDS